MANVNGKSLVNNAATVFRDKVTSLIQDLKNFTNDVDDVEVKNRIKEFLRSISDTYSFVVIGEVKAGKSSFINALLGDEVCAVSALPCTNIIHEIRYGVEDKILDVNDAHKRHFYKNTTLQNLTIVDTPGTNSIGKGHQVLTEKFIPASDVLLIIISATNPHTDSIWELLKNIKENWNKKIIFILQQKDLTSTESIQKSMDSVRKYAMEINIPDPLIFSVSAEEEINGLVDSSGYFMVREYLRNSVTNTNSLMLKQKSNIQSVNHILQSVKGSFNQRYEQYEVDLQIVNNINRTIDAFREKHDEKVNKLLEKLMVDIDKNIDDYQNKVIRCLDPFTIKERFESKVEFEKHLNILNSTYKEILNKSVERKTQQSLKNYFWEMEEVVNRATQLLEGRPVVLRLEDNIYGSIAQAKSNIVQETRVTLNELSRHNKTLYEASEEYFMGVWEARRKFENKKKATVAAGTAVTFGAGTTAAIIAGTKTVVAGAAATTTFSIGLPVIAIAIGTVFTSYGAFKLAGKLSGKLGYEEALLKEVEKCKETFNTEVENTKVSMKEQLFNHIHELFNQELKSMEYHFLEFRKSTYVEDSSLPKLKEKLEILERNSQQLLLEYLEV